MKKKWITECPRPLTPLPEALSLSPELRNCTGHGSDLKEKTKWKSAHKEHPPRPQDVTCYVAMKLRSSVCPYSYLLWNDLTSSPLAKPDICLKILSIWASVDMGAQLMQDGETEGQEGSSFWNWQCQDWENRIDYLEVSIFSHISINWEINNSRIVHLKIYLYFYLFIGFSK